MMNEPRNFSSQDGFAQNSFSITKSVTRVLENYEELIGKDSASIK